ncbi:DUF4126 domain-containing protein [Niabella terrae]
MQIDLHSFTAAALGVALAACCGFRVFVPMLVAGLAARFNIFHFSENFQWLASTPALICLGAATLLEIVAYYVPFIDNILDTIAAPLAAIAGTLIATSVIPIDAEWLKWVIGIVAGGGSAGLVASGTGLLRLLSSKTTLGTGNAVVSTGENAAAITGSVLSFVVPIAMALLFVLSFFWLIRKLMQRMRKGGKLRSADGDARSTG